MIALWQFSRHRWHWCNCFVNTEWNSIRCYSFVNSFPLRIHVRSNDTTACLIMCLECQCDFILRSSLSMLLQAVIFPSHMVWPSFSSTHYFTFRLSFFAGSGRINFGPQFILFSVTSFQERPNSEILIVFSSKPNNLVKSFFLCKEEVDLSFESNTNPQEFTHRFLFLKRDRENVFRSNVLIQVRESGG